MANKNNKKNSNVVRVPIPDGRITKEEIKQRIAYLLLGFFTFYIVEPAREYFNEVLHINPIIVGVVGMIAVLYFFDF